MELRLLSCGKGLAPKGVRRRGALPTLRRIRSRRRAARRPQLARKLTRCKAKGCRVSVLGGGGQGLVVALFVIDKAGAMKVVANVVYKGRK